MVTNQPKDSHLSEGCILQTRNLELRLRDGHLPSLGWSPTNLRMVTHNKEVCYRLGIVKLHSELALPTELQLDRVGVDFVFPLSQQQQQQQQEQQQQEEPPPKSKLEFDTKDQVLFKHLI